MPLSCALSTRLQLKLRGTLLAQANTSNLLPLVNLQNLAVPRLPEGNLLAQLVLP